MLPSDLPATWRKLATTLEPYAAPAAEAWRRAAEALEGALEAHANEPVTPEQAEAEGICGAEAVRAAVRQGRAENLGTETRYRVRRKDLPRGRKKQGPSFGKAAIRAAETANRREGR